MKLKIDRDISGELREPVLLAGWPGMGKYVVDSVNYLDFPAIMGFTLIVALAYVSINLFVDVLYAFLNPRITY